MGFFSSLSRVITGGAGADAARHAARDSADQLRASSSQATQQLQPWSTYGRQAMIPLSALLYGKNFDPATGNFTGDASQQDIMNSFQRSPGYQYQLDQGLKAVERRNAATGTLLGGNTQRELQETGQGLANQDYYNYINTLMGQAGVGQQADTSIANAKLNTGSQIAGYNYAGGMAQANQYNNLTNLLYGAVGSLAASRYAPSNGTPNPVGGGGGTYNGSFFNNAGMSGMNTSLSSGGF